MVDFNNEATVGTPAIDVQRISVLQRRYDFIEAYESFRKGVYRGSQSGLPIVRARLLSLFLEVRPGLKRHLKKERFLEVENYCYNADKESGLMGAFDEINGWLDSIHLTRLDMKKAYDSSDADMENKVKGYD